MKRSYSETEKEIIEVERRLIQRSARLGQHWRQLRENAVRKSLPLLIGGAAVTALVIALTSRNRKFFRPAPPPDKTSLAAKLVALASLIGTLRRLPIQPLLQWIQKRRNAPYTKSSGTPMAPSGRWP